MSILLKLNSNCSNCLEHSTTEDSFFFSPREEYFISDTELLAHGDKKKADRLLVNFIVLKFSTHNEPFLCLHLRQIAPSAPLPVPQAPVLHWALHIHSPLFQKPWLQTLPNLGKLRKQKQIAIHVNHCRCYFSKGKNLVSFY